MSYRLKARETVADGIRRIAREEAERASSTVSRTAPLEMRIHDARTQCKKLRGLLRLVRPNLGDMYDRENSFLRNAARRLAGARDATVVLRAFDDLARTSGSHREALGVLREDLQERLDSHREESNSADRLAEFGRSVRTFQERIEDWPAIGPNRFSTIEAGFRETYRRGCERLELALDSESAGDWHEWRKQAKFHWYHTRLLRNVWKPEMEARAAELRRLSELLGTDHDLALLRRVVEDPSGSAARHVELVHGLIDRQCWSLRSAARPLGRRLYAETPGALSKRVHRYWKAWRSGAKHHPRQ